MALSFDSAWDQEVTFPTNYHRLIPQPPKDVVWTGRSWFSKNKTTNICIHRRYVHCWPLGTVPWHDETAFRFSVFGFRISRCPIRSCSLRFSPFSIVGKSLSQSQSPYQPRHMATKITKCVWETRRKREDSRDGTGIIATFRTGAVGQGRGSAARQGV